MNIEFRSGLLFTKIEISYNGKDKEIENIVIDTGATQSLISQACVSELGIKVEKYDEIVTSYGIGGKDHAFTKIIEELKIGKYIFNNIQIDFTKFIYDDINGLLGLDILIRAGYVIDLSNLRLFINTNAQQIGI